MVIRNILELIYYCPQQRSVTVVEIKLMESVRKVANMLELNLLDTKQDIYKINNKMKNMKVLNLNNIILFNIYIKNSNGHIHLTRKTLSIIIMNVK